MTDNGIVKDDLSFSAKGDVKIIIRDAQGNIVDTRENHNLIVKAGRSDLIRLISAAPTKGWVTKCAVGTGGASAGTPFVPYVPADTDTALGTQTLIKSIATTTPNFVPTNPIVTFVTTFTAAEVNANVNEAGLFFNDGTSMFARYCFPTVSLLTASGFTMEIDWAIEF